MTRLSHFTEAMPNHPGTIARLNMPYNVDRTFTPGWAFQRAGLWYAHLIFAIPGK